MKKYPVFLFMTMLAASAAALFTSCKEDDETADEWTPTYAYIESEYFLRPSSVFVLDHTKDGEITGSEQLVIPFTVRLNQRAERDVNLSIKTLSENIPSEAVKLADSRVTIKKGEYQSAENVISIPDWTFAKEQTLKTNYRLSLTLEGTDNEIALSSNRSTVNFDIVKNARCNMQTGIPEASSLWAEAGKWTLAFQEGVENAGSNSVAGTGGSDVATNGVPFWVTIDLNDTYVVKGVQTKHWGSGYAPSQVEIFYSEDGENWISTGVTATAGATQNITFIQPLETRYLKYQMVKVPSRVDMTRFAVYVPAK